jgi:hypothetical protein
MCKFVVIHTNMFEFNLEEILLQKKISTEFVAIECLNKENVGAVQDFTDRYMNSPPTRNCSKKSRKSFSVAEGLSGAVAWGASCTLIL